MVRPRRSLLLFSILAAVLFVTSIYYLLIRDRTLRNTLSYATRPLWDQADHSFPSKSIAHYQTYGLPPNDTNACLRHGWPHRSKRPYVVDAIIFSTELDLLQLRLAELVDVVDKFVIVESAFTFMGKPKPLTFQGNRSLFAPWMEKISYHQVQGRPLAPGEDPFAIEGEQRRQVTDILNTLGLEEDSIVLMSDVDEMPSAATVSLLTACQAPFPIHLSLQEYVYSFEFPTGSLSWRASAHAWKSGTTFYQHGKSSDRILLDAGWHCSWCFKSISDFQFKMQSYSHSDRLFGNRHWRKLLDPKVIAKKICDGQDVFDMLPEAYTWSELLGRWSGERRTQSVANLPAPVLKDTSRYKYLLPGGCAERLP